jgi:hypothetical protein
MFNTHFNTISQAISKAIPKTIATFITNSNSIVIPKANTYPICESHSDYSLWSTLLQACGLWQWLGKAVSKYISSWYVAQVAVSIFCHIISMTVFCCSMCNYCSEVNSVLDGRSP